LLQIVIAVVEAKRRLEEAEASGDDRQIRRARQALAQEQDEADQAVAEAAKERGLADRAQRIAERERAEAECAANEARRERAEADKAAVVAAREVAEAEHAAREAVREREEAEAAKAKVAAVERAIHAASGEEELAMIIQELREIFHNCNPRKLADIGVLMEEWEGEERLLLGKVRAKYVTGSCEQQHGAAQSEVKQRNKWWGRQGLTRK
jgi:hypothetical protein